MKKKTPPPPKPPESSSEPPTPSFPSSAETSSGSSYSTISFLSPSNPLVDSIPADVPQELNIENTELIQDVTRIRSHDNHSPVSFVASGEKATQYETFDPSQLILRDSEVQ